ncbi:MAG: GTPase Era [Bacteroidia bacterium]
MAHKAGFVNIIGKPNAGKSTLTNALVGEKISIITAKAQTTRHRIMGIISDKDYQVVFSDTPGIIAPHYKMHEGMMQFVDTSFKDADVIVYVSPGDEDEGRDEKFAETFARLEKMEVPVLVVINKIDLLDNAKLEAKADFWKQKLPKAEIIPVSASEKFNTDYLLKRIKELLPDGPAFFPEDQLTDKSERFIAAEIIREKILRYYDKEIPYSVDVHIEQFKDEPTIIRIVAVIYVERESQKMILIGQGGKSIKGMGMAARKDMEKFFGKKIFLETTVKVKKDWRNDENYLKTHGYLE